MANVSATLYECERGLLPAACVKCGVPAVNSVPRPFPR